MTVGEILSNKGMVLPTVPEAMDNAEAMTASAAEKGNVICSAPIAISYDDWLALPDEDAVDYVVTLRDMYDATNRALAEMWGVSDKVLSNAFARRGIPGNRGAHYLDMVGWQHFLASRTFAASAPVLQKRRKRTDKAVEPPKEEIPVNNGVTTNGGKGGQSTGEINFASVTLEAAAAMIAALGATDKAVYDVRIVWD